MNRTDQIVAVIAACLGLVAVYSCDSAIADETISSCGNAPNEVFDHAAVFGINTYQACAAAAGAYLDIATAGNRVAAGQRAIWQATAPSGILIRDVTIPALHVNGINDGKQYGGGFYWHGGGVPVYDGGWSGFFGVDDGDSDSLPPISVSRSFAVPILVPVAARTSWSSRRNSTLRRRAGRR